MGVRVAVRDYNKDGPDHLYFDHPLASWVDVEKDGLLRVYLGDTSAPTLIAVYNEWMAAEIFEG
jgi:hypothetical protein